MSRFPNVFEDDESRTLFDDFTMRAARQAQKANPGLPLYQEVPLRSNAMWDGNNELGFEIPFTSSANNRQMVLKLGEWGAPRVWSVMLALELPPTLVAANIFTIRAEVQAGSGGTVDTFQMDWTRGTAFNVVCNSLIVNAVYNAVDSIPDGLVLRAIVGTEPLDGTAPALTENRAVDNATNVYVPIPKYAKDFVIYPVARGENPYQATMFYEQVPAPFDTSPDFASVQGDQLLTLGKVEIVNGGNFLRLSNTTGNTVVVSVRFNLAL